MPGPFPAWARRDRRGDANVQRRAGGACYTRATSLEGPRTMPNPRPLALALGLALATTLLAMPAADAAKKKKSTKKAEVSLVCSDFYSHANADWLAANKVAADSRSEEHTSELQSLMRISYAVFCLKNTK